MEILKGRGLGDSQVVLEIQVEGRGSKNMPSIGGGGGGGGVFLG